MPNNYDIDIESALLVDSLERQLDLGYKPCNVLYTISRHGLDLIPPDTIENVLKYVKRGANMPQLDGVYDTSQVDHLESVKKGSVTIVRVYVCS